MQGRGRGIRAEPVRQLVKSRQSSNTVTKLFGATGLIDGTHFALRRGIQTPRHTQQGDNETTPTSLSWNIGADKKSRLCCQQELPGPRASFTLPGRRAPAPTVGSTLEIGNSQVGEMRIKQKHGQNAKRLIFRATPQKANARRVKETIASHYRLYTATDATLRVNTSAKLRLVIQSCARTPSIDTRWRYLPTPVTYHLQSRNPFHSKTQVSNHHVLSKRGGACFGVKIPVPQQRSERCSPEEEADSASIGKDECLASVYGH